MKIEKIDPKSVVWRRSISNSLYIHAYKNIEEMQIGEALRVELDEPRKSFAGSVTSTFRRRKADFSLRTMKEDKEGKIWVIMKLKKRTKKRIE